MSEQSPQELDQPSEALKQIFVNLILTYAAKDEEATTTFDHPDGRHFALYRPHIQPGDPEYESNDDIAKFDRQYQIIIEEDVTLENGRAVEQSTIYKYDPVNEAFDKELSMGDSSNPFRPHEIYPEEIAAYDQMRASLREGLFVRGYSQEEIDAAIETEISKSVRSNPATASAPERGLREFEQGILGEEELARLGIKNSVSGLELQGVIDDLHTAIAHTQTRPS